jgi:hypothetical protein
VKHEDSDDAPIQVDLYGLRTSISPRPEQTPDPDSWREVARRLNRELMSITTNSFALLSQTLKSAISLVRGVGNLPSAVNTRITRAHETADLAELANSRPAPSIRSTTAAREHLQAVVRKLESRGLQVTIVEREQRLVITVLPSLPADEIQRIAATALRELEAAGRQTPPGRDRD